VDPGKRDELVSAINEVRLWAQNVQDGEITVSEDANKLFEKFYKDYFWRCQKEGLIPTLIVRLQDAIWKLALLYAAMDRSKVITAQHLQPAIAVGIYLEESVAEIFRSFSDTRGRQLENKVIDYLRNVGHAVDYRHLYRYLNMSAKELDSCIKPLVELGIIRNSYRLAKTGRKIRMLELVEKC
jgi:hypothetical protein